ncbi:MAG: tripartite tricarboxylate transporter substrate binding protein [Hyphomicrobiales bacterium]|nr:tripartite tricarboxylate transporter substrate binding protein [Alphaproteobacteria bacterium]
MISRRTLAGAIAILCVSTPSGFAQQWPSRNVKVVVPYGVGGVTDTMARLTADRLGKMLNQTFVVENKLGAGGAIGVDYVVNAPQDGHTILFVGSTLFTVLPIANKVNYEPLKDLVPVSITGTNGMVMVVQKDAPYSTLREFIDYARANPGKITYSSGGPATNNHLSTAYLAGKEKLDMVHVPFGGGQAALTAVLSKSVDMHFGNSSDLIEPVKAGTAKALAVSTKERMPQLPNVPTVAETVPGYEYLAWNGYAVTGGVPKEVVTRLAAALKVIAGDPEVVKVFSNLGIESVGTSAEEAEASIRKDMPIFSQVVDMAGVRRK